MSGPESPDRPVALRPAAPPPLGGVLAAVVALLAGLVLASLLASIAVGLGAHQNDAFADFAAFVGLWSGFVGVPVYLSRTRGTGQLATDFGFRLGGPADIGLGVAAAFVVYGLVEAYSAAIRAAGDHADLGHEAQQLSGHGLGPAFVLFAASVAIGAPLVEELFFRGLTQPALQRHLGGVGGLLAASVAFGFAHYSSGNPIEVVPALAFVGLVFGLLYWRTGRLGPGIVAHMTFNGITVVALALSR